jgi:hypothetical protein
VSVLTAFGGAKRSISKHSKNKIELAYSNNLIKSMQASNVYTHSNPSLETSKLLSKGGKRYFSKNMRHLATIDPNLAP